MTVATSCDPVSNTGCSFPNGCWLLSGERTACAQTGTGGQGASCSTTSECQGGYGCFALTCRKICDITTGDGCDAGSMCNGITGYVHYGACT
jgi:hypothetical protein